MGLLFTSKAGEWAGLACITMALSSCGVTLREGVPTHTGRDALRIREHASDRCMHGSPGLRRAPGGEDIEDLTPELRNVLTQFEPEVLRTARAGGLEVLLARVSEAHRARFDGTASPEELALRQELLHGIDSLETQLTAMEFECDCVRALINDVLGRYEEDETDRQLVLTIASLSVGAAASVAAAVWDLVNAHTETPVAEDGSLYAAILGAVSTTALGIAVLVPEPREIAYRHPRNLLAPLVRGEDPERIYAPFVFHLMTLPTVDGTPTARDTLLSAWEELWQDQVDEEQRRLAERIVYGEGGVYSSTLLSLHQELLQLLGAALDSFAREIDRLSHAVTEVLAEER